MKFQRETLDNGLTIISEANPDAASVALGFFVRTGSRDEQAEISGVSHFLEHMVFKGTVTRSALDVNRQFDEMGAQNNAFTSEENTVYYAAVLPEFQTAALELLCDLMRPALREEDFNVEKGVILEEIALYEDQPAFRVYDKLMAAHYAGHPLGQAILGTTESIRTLSAGQMREYFNRRYGPGNLTVVATGKLDVPALLETTRRLCAAWPGREAARPTPPATAACTSAVIRDEKVLREHIGLMSAGPSAQDKDHYAAQLAAMILGDATGSRLYYALIETALADEASMTCQCMDQAGGMATFISADPPNAARALAIARDELRRFVQDGPTDAELTAAKNKLASGRTLQSEVPMGRFIPLGGNWVYRREYLSLQDELAAWLAVTKEQVAAVACRFRLDATTLVALGPLESL